MKRIIGPLALAALLSAPSLAQAEGMGLYVAPKMGFGYLDGFDLKYVEDEGYSEKINVGSDTVFGGGIAVGYDFKHMGVPVRAELEYAAFGDAKVKGKKRFKEWGVDVTGSATIGIQTLFVNGYFDFHNSSAFTPYVGLGLGQSFIDMKAKGQADLGGYSLSGNWGRKSTTDFAWNLSGGVSYAITKQIGLDLGYRFAWLGKGETKKVYYGPGGGYDYFKTKDLQMHQVMLGMRYTF
ncbi:MAG: outer membrane beta-barrel protein [Betaproteobacteria bacterium]|nr:outer membrane beta-barrel protein [Betaproteobacteria bacterium]